MRSSVPELVLGLLASAASGFAGLGVLYCIVWVISDGDATWIARALVLAAVGAAFGAAASWLAHDGEARFAARVRRAVAAHMVRLPSSTLSRLDGERRRRLMSDDIASLHHLIAHVPAEVAVLLVIPAAAIVLLVALAGPVILLALIPGALAALMYLVVIPAMAARGNAEQADHLGRITSSADDYVRGVRTFRVYGTDAGAAAGFRSSTAAFVDSMTRRVGSVAVPAAFTVGLLQAPATLAIAFAVTYGQPLRTVAAALLLCLAVVTPALRLGHGIDYIGAGRAAGRRIDDFLALPALGSAGGAGYSLEPGDLIVKNLAVEIEGRRVLDRFDQTFRQGRLTAVLGRSGTGKSTLLRAVAGTEPNCAGTIELGGTPLDDLGLDARLRSVRMIAQVAPVVSTTVRENLLVAGADDVQDSLLEDALRRAQLVVDLDRPASELSGGQAQRVGLARVFLSSAPVVLLDEPTSALDPNAARAVVVELAEYARRSGAVVVMVTHDHAVAELADATVVLGSNDTTEALR